MNAPNKIYLYWNKEDDPNYVTWDIKKIKGAVNIPYVRQNSIKLCDNLTCDKGKTLKEGTCEVVDCLDCDGQGWVVR